jgi:hypothetical protein
LQKKLTMPNPTTAQPSTHIHQDDARAQAIVESGWAHNPYAKRSAEAQASAIADEFILLFEEALRKRQCRAVTGIEVECRVEDPIGQPDSGARLVKEVARDITNALTHMGKQHGDPRYGTVYHAYNDNGNLEVVTRPLRPSEAVHTVDMVKRVLVEASQNFAEIASPGARSMRAEMLARRHAIGEVRFVHRPGERTLGEHINLSIHHTDSDAPSGSFDLGKWNATYADTLRALDHTLLHCYPYDLALLTSSERSFARLQETRSPARMDFTPDHKSPFSAVKKPLEDRGNQYAPDEFYRMEFRVPDGASNTHYTMLYTLASTYLFTEALQHATGSTRPPQVLKPEERLAMEDWVEARYPVASVPRSMAQATKQFQTRSLTVEMMHAVVEEMIPESEKPIWHDKIATFKQLVCESRAQAAQRG